MAIYHGHLMSRNDQQPICGNAACGNQRPKIKHCQQDCPNGGTAEKTQYTEWHEDTTGKILIILIDNWLDQYTERSVL